MSDISFKPIYTHPQSVTWEFQQDEDKCQTLAAHMGMGGGNVPLILVTFTTEMTPKVDENGVAFSLRNRDYKDPQCIVVRGAKTYRKTGHPQTAEQGQGWEETNVNDTLSVYDVGEIRTPTLVTEENMSNAIVRRLTPLECSRLQGYPEIEEDGNIIGWCDIGEWVDSKGKVHKEADSPKYKALGNSIGLPFWQWLADRIVNQLKEDGVDNPTMASLFDGIGGFPLVFMRAGCKPVWTSEVEEFCIAVTSKHFGDELKGIEGDIEKYL